MEDGIADAETIEAFVLTGLETNHLLKMAASRLIDLIPPESVTYLAEFLADERSEVQAQAAFGLGAIGPEAAGTLGQLLSLLRTGNRHAASAAGVAISRIDVSDSTFPELLELLRDPSANVRENAALALDRFGNRVNPIVGKIIPLLADDDEAQRYSLVIVVANAKASDPAVAEALIGLLLKDPSPLVRERIARVFWEMGRSSTPIPPFAIQVLVRTLKTDPADSVRSEAAKALASNRRLAMENRDVLHECIENESGNLRKICQGAVHGEFR